MATSTPTNHLPDAAYAFPGAWRGTMTRRQAKETLLATSGWVMAAGYIRDVLVEDAGAGVVRVRLSDPR